MDNVATNFQPKVRVNNVKTEKKLHKKSKEGRKVDYNNQYE